jgi:hypothetical protein
MSDICLVCGEDYPPNGIVMCDDCGMDKDIEQQQERGQVNEEIPRNY